MPHKYNEAMAAVRHYSNLRFAIMTVFLAVTGALINHTTSINCNEQNELCNKDTVKIIGIWVSIVFLIFEASLNYYIRGYTNMASDIEASTWKRNQFIAVTVEVASISIPVGILFLWLYKG